MMNTFDRFFIRNKSKNSKVLYEIVFFNSDITDKFI